MNMIIPKRKVFAIPSILLALSFTLAATAYADNKHDHKHDHKHDKTHEEQHSSEQHEAHVHGMAVLQLIQEGSELLLTLNSAAGNLLGFEHAPQTDEQKEQLLNTERKLKNSDTLFQIVGGECALRSQQNNVQKLFAKHSENHHEHAHEHDHQHTSDDHHESEDQHENISSEYQYHCSSPSDLNAIEIKLVAHFPALETLEVEWIVANRQGAQTLDNNNGTIRFR